MPDKQKPDQKQPERKGRENVSDDESTDESTDLEKREYRGADGEVHHHTKKYMEEHEGSKKED